MKKAAGITLMVALLGFNAYLWPTLINEMQAAPKKEESVQKNEKGIQTETLLSDSTPIMDLSNQGPRPAGVSAYPVQQPAGQSNPSVVVASKPVTESKKQSSPKGVQTASSKNNKISDNKPSTPSRQSDGPDVHISYTIEPYTIHYEETTYTTNSRYSGGSFNMPLEYNPYTGRIQEVYKVNRGREYFETPMTNTQSFGIPENIQPYVPPVDENQQRLAPQSYPGR
ncbi:hypothetical protein [Brevibacillus reuszeri]|uniref:hypothetical protein n=1 Tax=Brevibacillus reuszeri TaxID=54915 RepID=UPI003D1AE076